MIWVVSIKQAFTTLNRNRTLIAIALISVVFGKIIDLMTSSSMPARINRLDLIGQALQTGHYMN